MRFKRLRNEDFKILQRLQLKQLWRRFKQMLNLKDTDMKKLFRSNKDKKIFGVCGGLGEFFDIDPTFIRLAFVVAALVYGSGALLYLILALIAPEKPFGED